MLQSLLVLIIIICITIVPRSPSDGPGPHYAIIKKMYYNTECRQDLKLVYCLLHSILHIQAWPPHCPFFVNLHRWGLLCLLCCPICVNLSPALELESYFPSLNVTWESLSLQSVLWYSIWRMLNKINSTVLYYFILT